MQKTSIQIRYNGDFFVVKLDGELDYEISQNMWASIVEQCNERKCYNILGISTVTKPPNIIESYNHYILFKELGIDDKYHIAWVENNSTTYLFTKFVEALLRHKRLPGKVFKTENEAKDWLRQFCA